MPNVSRAQTVSFKFQSSWTPEDIFHDSPMTTSPR
jgi:hypothetical protein